MTRRQRFRIIIKGFDWPDPLPIFSERDSAIGYGRGLMGKLLHAKAPDRATVTVLCGRAIVATWSVASWRVAIKLVGEKIYA